ncbi:(2Fe-2S) ferredoxin domain-containing protein [Leeia oryzae]|uniref:(2Fe-2S) ferredoxin domain-containing protein n=1 Tax=Leeia oryzae TaxID=356662 RepID=UPI000362EC5E|nr:(2Fe-2S) ferredoxin domain-containing protein [Leeia oryzae]
MQEKAVALVVCVKKRYADHQPSCGGRGSQRLYEQLKMLAQPAGIAVVPFPCLGACEYGPNIRISPGGPFFNRVTETQLPDLIAEAISFRDGLNDTVANP